MGVALCAATSGLVFVLNLTLTVWASSKYGLEAGVGTIHYGSCDKTRSLSLWLHILINLLSTLLLGASNYTMQCLTSPTRDEIDRAHSCHDWLDVGVPSLRNLRRISRDRALLWWLLALSGIPLHLFYNSAVFSTLARQDYSVFAASPELITGAVADWSASVERVSGMDEPYTLQRFQDLSTWKRLKNEDCMRAYAQSFVSSQGDVLAISASLNASQLIYPIADSWNLPANVWNGKTWAQPWSVEDSSGNYVNPVASNYTPPYLWICYNYQIYRPQRYSGDWCDPNVIIANKHAAGWTLSAYDKTEQYTVQYCLSQPIVERCKVQFGLVIMSVVIVCNFLKGLCMVLTLWCHKSQPLVTLGDAIESFLRKADPTTENMCFAGKAAFLEGQWKRAPIAFVKDQWSWSSSVSYRRWMSCNLLSVTPFVDFIPVEIPTFVINLPLCRIHQLSSIFSLYKPAYCTFLVLPQTTH